MHKLLPKTTLHVGCRDKKVEDHWVPLPLDVDLQHPIPGGPPQDLIDTVYDSVGTLEFWKVENIGPL